MFAHLKIILQTWGWEKKAEKNIGDRRQGQRHGHVQRSTYWRQDMLEWKAGGTSKPRWSLQQSPLNRKLDKPSFYILWPFASPTKCRHLWSISSKVNVQIHRPTLDGWKTATPHIYLHLWYRLWSNTCNQKWKALQNLRIIYSPSWKWVFTDFGRSTNWMCFHVIFRCASISSTYPCQSVRQ